MNIKVGVVVVTYNRLELLKKTIQTINSQTYEVNKIFIVDNNSVDGTKEYLSTIKDNTIVPILHERNMGGAGGFHTGIKKAYEEDMDWIWIMDDDCHPWEDALERLVSVLKEEFIIPEKVGFLTSRVLWKDGSICKMNIPRPARDWNAMHGLNKSITKILSCSFVSILLNRDAIRKVGLPVKEFFIYFDDVEYTTRISDLMNGYYIPNSSVTHLMEDNEETFNLYKYKNKKYLWKLNYDIRNGTSYIKYNDPNPIRGTTKAFIFLMSRIHLLIVTRQNIFDIFRLGISGIKGLFFNYKKHITFP